MKHQRFILLLLLTTSIACNNIHNNNHIPANDSTRGNGPAYSCSSLKDKKIGFQFAREIIDNWQRDPEKNRNIWNLSGVDTTKYLAVEGHFINAQTMSMLVLLGGEAGGSSGSASNLLMIFDCARKPVIVWVGQMGDIAPTDIKDLDNDGIEEIVCTAATIYMGECNSSFQIFNFKNGAQNIRYSADSHSVIDCGSADTLATLYKPGDTLASDFESKVIRTPDAAGWSVQQKSTYKIHNGGKTDEELMARLKIVTATSVIALK